jgi:hypothetical protein
MVKWTKRTKRPYVDMYSLYQVYQFPKNLKLVTALIKILIILMCIYLSLGKLLHCYCNYPSYFVIVCLTFGSRPLLTLEIRGQGQLHYVLKTPLWLTDLVNSIRHVNIFPWEVTRKPSATAKKQSMPLRLPVKTEYLIKTLFFSKIFNTTCWKIWNLIL